MLPECCNWRPVLSSSFIFLIGLLAGWIDHVEPVLTKPEKEAYRALRDESSRAHFEDGFWSGKNISRDEYDERLAHIDSLYGSWRTDRGRVYLSLGAPQKIARLSSTRSFWPIEIWHYSSAENIGYTGAVQFLFYQRNQTGDYRLYSPTLDTFTALLNPQSATRGAFRHNDLLTEGDVRNTMSLTPAETEIVDAAFGIAKGVKGVENDSLLARAASPAEALSRKTGFAVNARFLTSPRPALTTFQSWSEDVIAAVDLSLEAAVQRSIGISIGTESTELKILGRPGDRIRYQHRLWLLPGSYTLTISIDGVPFSYPVQVSSAHSVSEILTGEIDTQQVATPFQFGSVHWNPSEAAQQALLQVGSGETVKWRLHQNARTVWTGLSKGPIAVVRPEAPPGVYQLEASTGREVRECRFVIGAADSRLPVISYNANLGPASRAQSLGRQWLARGHLLEARSWLERSRSFMRSDSVSIDLARLSAMAGDLDGPRQTLLEILARKPDQFEALTVLGFIEAQLQDYAVAAKYYSRAMAIRPSPALEKALEHVNRELKKS